MSNLAVSLTIQSCAACTLREIVSQTQDHAQRSTPWRLTMNKAGLSERRSDVTVLTRAVVLMRATVLEPEVWMLNDTAITLLGSTAVVGVSSSRLTTFSHFVGCGLCA